MESGEQERGRANRIDKCAGWSAFAKPRPGKRQSGNGVGEESRHLGEGRLGFIDQVEDDAMIREGGRGGRARAVLDRSPRIRSGENLLGMLIPLLVPPQPETRWKG